MPFHLFLTIINIRLFEIFKLSKQYKQACTAVLCSLQGVLKSVLLKRATQQPPNPPWEVSMQRGEQIYTRANSI